MLFLPGSWRQGKKALDELPCPSWALWKRELALERSTAQSQPWESCKSCIPLAFLLRNFFKYKSTSRLTLNGAFPVMTQSQKQKDSYLGMRISGVCLTFIFLIWVGLKVYYHDGNRILWKQNKLASLIFYPQHWLKLNSNLIYYNL